MGSTSDWDVMKAAVETLEELGIEYEKRVISAHRTPHLMVEYAESARERGIGAIIAGAGGAAHVAGVTAALTTVPVIGVPIKTSALGVGTIEDGHARIVNLFMAGKMAYALCQQVGLVGLAIGLLYLDGCSHIIAAVDILMNLVAVVVDEAVGGIHNGLCAAVVLFQLE